MANRLKVATQQAILVLWQRGMSFRGIARTLGVHRETVSRHVREAQANGEAKPAIPPPGTEGDSGAEPAIVTPGTGAAEGADPCLEAVCPALASCPKPAIPTPGAKSKCEPLREVIDGKVEQGLSAQRIFQDISQQEGFTGSYQSVKRFVRKLRGSAQLPFRRMECEPGAEAQVDFGRGAPIVGQDGRRRRTHVLRVVLSHSRKGYSEAVLRQTTESFIRCLENAFWALGGVARTLVIDNLRAAVTKADWYDPELNPKIEAFCRHYGTIIMPTRPYTPRHKGKIERGVGYVQDNALKGLTFASLADQNRYLAQWESQVADHRIHGTTRRQVGRLFHEVERQALLPLPPDRFPFFHEATRAVHRDAHVEVDKAYYSVPPEHVGRRVWVRWDVRLVRIFTMRMEPLAVHVKAEPGRFSTKREHIASQKMSAVERGAEGLLRRASLIGPHACRWAESMLTERGVQGLRVLQGLIALAAKHRSGAIDRACELALTHRAFRLKDLRRLMEHPVRQQQLDLMTEHPLIRSISHYGHIVKVSLRQQENGLNGEFNAWWATSGEPQREEPTRGRG